MSRKDFNSEEKKEETTLHQIRSLNQPIIMEWVSTSLDV